MKLSMKTLNQIKGSLARLLTAQNIPVRVSYRAAKFAKAVDRKIRDLEEMRIGLVKKYGEKDADGNYQVTDEHDAEFQKVFEEMLSEEFEVPDVKIKVDDLANAGLTMLDIANLDFILSEIDPTETK